ncbi:MAG TPA: hypothetical protein VID04_14270 [Methylomirabilota bacterium]
MTAMTSIMLLLLAFLMVQPLAASAQTSASVAPTEMIDGGVNWTRQIIYAKGIGATTPSAESAEHGRSLAVEAALTAARRELLNIVRGVRIDDASTVQDAMAANPALEARMPGVVRGSQLVEVRELGGGAVEVTVALAITGDFAALVLPAGGSRPPTTTGHLAAGPRPPVSVPAVIYTGLVVDARGLGVRPALLPKVVTEGGDEVYGISVVDRSWAIQHGLAAYAKSLPAARTYTRVANRPLTIRAVAAAGAHKTNIVVSTIDGQLLLGSGQNLAFLEKARVMVVVD